ncbi:MAG: polyphenol oxidase family protein [Acidobacteriaceae bacterium]|jgi:YfiH family protein|nr:polyphenol oxidase family protein [Acidobacteriaceae bacterium]
MILPAPDASFAWQVTERGPALVCVPLLAFAPHFFTTRAWWLGGRHASASYELDAWEELRHAFPRAPSHLVHARQVHGAAVVVATASATSPELPTGDIVISADADVAVAIQVADCVPLLLADRRTGAVAAVHSGWRGLAANVPGVALNALRDHYGTRAEDVMAAAGPSIGACCYQVGADVYDAMSRVAVSKGSLDRWCLRAPARLARNPPYEGAPLLSRDDRWFFDGWAATRDLLIAGGVASASIYQCGLCTASHGELFCSYRRDGSPAGRIAGAIRPAGV